MGRLGRKKAGAPKDPGPVVPTLPGWSFVAALPNASALPDHDAASLSNGAAGPPVVLLVPEGLQGHRLGEQEDESDTLLGSRNIELAFFSGVG